MTTTPPDLRGITWRPLRVTDGPALHALYRRWEAHHALPWRTSIEEVEHDLTDPSGEIDERSMAAIRDDEIAGVAWLFHSTGVDAPKHRVFLWAIAMPGDEEIEDALLDWAEDAGARLAARLEPDLPRILRAWSPTSLPGRIRRFEQRGFRIARWFVEMIRPLADPIPAAPPPEGVEIVPWDPDRSQDAWMVHVEAFADHWGSIAPDLDDWNRSWVGDHHFRADLSLLAVAGDEVVAYAINKVFPDDFEVRGRKEGYINTLGTARGWRKRGIASALLAESMRRFAAAGLDHAFLGVDSESETGAHRLYERLGYVESDRNVSLVKDLL